MMSPFEVPEATKTVIAAEKAKGKKSYADWFDKSAVKSAIKNFYMIQQSYSCCYCGEVIGKETPRLWDLEHILPSSIYHQHICEPMNLAVACTDCNGPEGKYNYDVLSHGVTADPYPTTGDAFTIPHPHIDRYEDHIHKCGFWFEPVNDSAKGKTLIAICRLHRYAKEAASILEKMSLTSLSATARQFNDACNAGDWTAIAVHGVKIADTFNGVRGKAVAVVRERKRPAKV